ncbi:MAG: DUF1320 domain-containing protein [Zoogloeaceae bacterium]|nr:DUF1320 domain-containing protein [Zoogloeaceae bacterium]
MHVRKSEKSTTASTDATSEIDAALIARYKVPLAPVPPLVRRIACELVWELIHLNQGNCPKAVHELAETARRLLRDLATGILRLDVEAVESGPITSDARIITTKTRMEW